MEQVQAASIKRQRAPLYALIGATAVSEIGSMLTLVALPWFVLQTTGSAARTGLTGFSVAIPGFFVGIFGGTIVDRLGFRRSSVVADVVSGIGLGLVPTLYFTVGLPFVVLMGLVFIGSMLAIPGITARRSLLPELATAAGMRLERVNSAFESIQHLALLLGPPAAGLLIAWQSATTVLWIDAGTFFFSAIMVSLFIPMLTAGAESDSEESARYRDRLIAGLRFLKRDALLRDMAITVGIFNGLGAPAFAVAMPVFARDEYGSATILGLMASGFAVGALSGVAVYGAVGHRVSRRTIWYAGHLVMSAVYWVMIVHTSLAVLLITLGCMGFLTSPINPMMTTIRHERIPSVMRGRVFATFSAITQIVSPIGIVLGGFAISSIGFQPTLIALAIAMQLGAFALFLVPSLRRMGAPSQ